MATVNKVMLIGRLTRDPEPPRTLPNSGNRVVKFGFAVGRSRKNPQTGQWESDPNPMFIDCEAFTKDNFTRLVDVITNYCKKGSQIYVEGQLRLDTWDDKTTGQKRSKHKILVDDIQLLDGRGPDAGTEGSRATSSAPNSQVSHSANESHDSYDEPPQEKSGGEIPF